MQYRTGTIDVVNGDATIVGNGTAFDTEVQAGDLLTVVDSNVWYEVASVTDATHLELSANYAGTTANGIYYVILRDFTTPDSIPYPQQGDIETASILKRSIAAIQTVLSSIFHDLGNKSGAVTINFKNGKHQKITLVGNVTLTLPSDKNYANCSLLVRQGSLGNYTLTISGFAAWKDDVSYSARITGKESLIRLNYSGSQWNAEVINYGL